MAQSLLTPRVGQFVVGEAVHTLPGFLSCQRLAYAHGAQWPRLVYLSDFATGEDTLAVNFLVSVLVVLWTGSGPACSAAVVICGPQGCVYGTWHPL